MKLLEMMEQGSSVVQGVVKKLAPPLVTLLSAEPEIQYVALRNINLIVQKRCVYTYIWSLEYKINLLKNEDYVLDIDGEYYFEY